MEIISSNDLRYQNPILRGFFPDPSITRVLDDYYMVNSSFEYWPAIPISYSKDLVNWKIIGHAVTNPDYIDLAGIDDSHGFWAPDISYYNGTFYIFATLRLSGRYDKNGGTSVHRQMMVKSSKPEGPYSRPLFIEISGIDPSHFIDNGKHYMVLSAGARLIPLDDECTKAIGDVKTIWPGTGERCPEGPHILKKGDYYYIILAEGGTGYGHRISVARSRNLYGPYEESPYNPVLYQTNPDAPIQRTGHGKLVETQNGEWWCVYLSARPNHGKFTTLGRETSLDPVTWTEDGWFLINNGQGPSLENRLPDLHESKFEKTTFYDFNQDKLPLDWHWARNPNPDLWSLTERPGHLRLKTSNMRLGSKYLANLLCHREEELDYSVMASLEFYPRRQGHEAGIVHYWGIYSWIKCVAIFDKQKTLVLSISNDGKRAEITRVPIAEGIIFLKSVVRRQRRKYLYWLAPERPATLPKIEQNKQWSLLGYVENASFLAGESISQGKAHTGTMFGLYASASDNAEIINADFDWVIFDYPSG